MKKIRVFWVQKLIAATKPIKLVYKILIKKILIAPKESRKKGKGL